MGFFDSGKPHVSKDEFRKVKSQLHAEGHSEHDLDKLEARFMGDLEEEGSNKGIDRKELEQGIKDLRAKRHDYGLSEDLLKKAEEKLKKRL